MRTGRSLPNPTFGPWLSSAGPASPGPQHPATQQRHSDHNAHAERCQPCEWRDINHTASIKAQEEPVSITAKVKVSGKTPAGNGQTRLSIYADYADDRNKEWSKYTPALSMTMTVLDSVAERFEPGQAFTLTFEPSE